MLSPAMLEEVGRVLTHEKLWKHRWLSADEVVELLEALASQSVVVPATTRITPCRDPEDDKFLAAGLESEADDAVTGDKDPLALEAYRGLRIITPAAFLKVLRGPETT